MALTSLKHIFSSQQQQEALPDETEVVEETVAEVAEVGGWDPRLHLHSVEKPDECCGVLTLEQSICPFLWAHTAQM